MDEKELQETIESFLENPFWADYYDAAPSGAKEIIEEGETGLLVNEPSEFAAAIVRALDGSWAPANDLRARMLRCFNAERFAEETLKVYQEVIGGS